MSTDLKKWQDLIHPKCTLTLSEGTDGLKLTILSIKDDGYPKEIALLKFWIAQDDIDEMIEYFRMFKDRAQSRGAA